MERALVVVGDDVPGAGECGADQRVGFVVGAGVAGAGGDGAGQRLCGVERGHPDRVVNELRTSCEIASVIRGTAHPDRNHADGGPQHMGIARRHPPACTGYEVISSTTCRSSDGAKRHERDS